jgi:DNA (cytosine-5)-methyltransferase 1
VTGLVVDLFAGGGGASTGIEAALGRPVDLAVNHSAVAIAVHEANHRGTRHLTSDVYEVDPVEATRGEAVELLWASPDCTHFSRAKGSRPDRPRSKKIRSLAWVVVRWAKAVRPRVICLENVEEFETWGPLGKDGQPLVRRMGETYRAWRRALERLGYVIDSRVLDASRYGAPTRRKRLFVVARCDGQPIVWPAPTHGLGLLPFRTAGECIDWSITTRSIFGRKKPLADKTLQRIAEGIRRFVLENPRPYIVRVNHGRDIGRVQETDEPLTTVEATRRGHAVVAPHLVKFRHDSSGQTVDAPMPTITSGGNAGGRPAGAAHALGVSAASLVPIGYGERDGQRTRTADIAAPLGTVVGAKKHAVACAAFVAKHFGGVYGQHPDEPIGTVTARDHHGPVAAALLKFRGAPETHPQGSPLDEPMPTITAGGMHLAECRAFLTKFYSSKGTKGASLFDPAPTATAKARFGLVVVDGVEYEIGDIFLRMLEPEELLRAQFGDHAQGYDLSPARTKEAKTRLIGNSVCPDVAAALVRANVGVAEEVAA